MTRPACLLAAGLLALLSATPTHAEDPPGTLAPLPENVVARVAGRDLNYEGFYLAAAQQQIPRMAHEDGGPTAILRVLVETRVVKQLCDMLGIRVTDAQVAARLERYDTMVRTQSRGTKTLDDIMRENSMTKRELEAQMLHALRREMLARHPSNLGDSLRRTEDLRPEDQDAQLLQIETVIKEAMSAARIEIGVPTKREPEAATLPAGIVARLQADPKGRTPTEDITYQAFGRALVEQLPSGDVRGMLDQECKSGLLASQGHVLSDAAFDAEMAHQSKVWDIQRRMTSQAAMASLSFEEYMRLTNRMSVADMRRKHYWRGFFSLIAAERRQIPDAEVRKHYEARKQSIYGPRILVTDIRATYRSDRSPFAHRGMRTLRQARKLLAEFPRRLAQGIPFEELARRINQKQDPSFRADQRRLRPIDEDRLLWNAAKILKDGDLSTIVEELSEVHLIRREREIPAPSYDAVRLSVLESMARERARAWLNARIKDPRVVRVRWPLPIR